MDNFLQIIGNTQLNIKIPATILAHTQLSFNQKLLLGLDYTFSKKLGYNSMSNKSIGELLNLHPNIVSYCRRKLLKEEFTTKQGKKYSITDKHLHFEVLDNREILVPHQVYNYKINTGAKLLWGEYNSISKGHKEYFAKRLYTAKRLNASEESVTNWTKQLFENNLLSEYYLKKGYCKSQKVIVTYFFDR